MVAPAYSLRASRAMPKWYSACWLQAGCDLRGFIEPGAKTDVAGSYGRTREAHRTPCSQGF